MALPVLETQDSLSTLVSSSCCSCPCCSCGSPLHSPTQSQSKSSAPSASASAPSSSTHTRVYLCSTHNNGCGCKQSNHHDNSNYTKTKSGCFRKRRRGQRSQSRSWSPAALASLRSFGWFTIGFGAMLSTFLIAWYSGLVRFNFNPASMGFNQTFMEELHGVPHGRARATCTTSVCMQAASRLLSRYNASADPCVDFYEFSCGNFVSENEIPDDSFQRSTLQEMQESLLVQIKKLIDVPGSVNEGVAVKKARDLYRSCMHGSFRTSHYSDYKYLPIFSILNEGQGGIGRWPILEGDKWNRSEFNLEKLLSHLFIHQVQNIFKLYVSPDELDPTKYLLEFYKGEPSVASAFYLNSTHPDYVRYIRSYRRLLLESVLILSHGKQGSPTVTSDVDAVLAFETKFAKLVQNTRCHLDGYDFDGGNGEGEEDYGHITVADIHAKIPQVDWMVLIQNLFDALDLERKVTPDMIVYFHCSDFFHGLVSLMQQTDTRTMSNYLIWRFVFRYMPFLGNKFLQIWMEFMKDVPDTNEERLHLSRWKQCVAVVNDGFGMAVASLYVEQHYGDATEAKVKEMIAYLKRAFEKVIRAQDWVPEVFKDKLVEKLTSMGEKIGLPAFALDPKALEREYEGLEFGDDYFLMNILKLRRFEVRKEIRRINQPVDKDKDWIILPLVANAFHNPTANEIVIPLGILRYPMFDPELPMYMNFANLGIVIAHEMTHGFDHIGRFYDKDGNFTSWWTEEVTSAFKTQAICFTEQYAKFTMPVIKKQVDGNHTLADNICDNASLRISYLAYQMWAEEQQSQKGTPPEPLLVGLNMSIPQLFYLSYGQIWCEVLNKEGYENYVRDPHSPGMFRTIGVAQNNKQFGEIFHCEAGSQMNPSSKCQLWS